MGQRFAAQFTATQDLPVLSLYAFYSICVQDGAGQLVDESCRRELVDAQNWGLLPMVFGKATPTPAPTSTPMPFPSDPAPTVTPTATAPPSR
ncbi:MAG: hypothetical protein R2911_35465 [Caldilineaceae bacterium]